MSPQPTLAKFDHVTLTGFRILVVEDEYFLADDITHALQSRGALVVGPAGYLDEALNLLDSGEVIDAAVLDINIGREMVYPLALALRSRGVPFVFTTGYDKVTIEPEFQDELLWEKPIDVGSMVRGLSGLIANAKLNGSKI